MKRVISLAMLAVAATANAHVSLEQPEGEAGMPYKAVLRFGHGCQGSPTRQIVVTMPAGFRGAKPVPKAGWALATQRAPLAQPYESHGKQVLDDVVEVAWTATSEGSYLQDDWYDEFVVRGTLPGAPATLWFKVRQVCVKGEWNWAEVPTAIGPRADAPAVRLNVVRVGAR